MKAVVQRRYGGPEALGVEERPRPEAEAGTVIVRVRAAPVTQGDWHLMRGEPFLIRLMGFGLRRPKHAVPGQYFAGEVDAVGEGAPGLVVGDRVWGFGEGAFAELVRARPEQLAPMPAGLGFEEAAAVPHGGFAALQALRDVAKVGAGQRVLVNGAGGAVGMMAVQIAGALGADVTAVVRAGQEELVRGLGARRVVVASDEDFVARPERYDAVLDMVRNRSDRDLRRVLVDGGCVVMVSGGSGRLLGGMGRMVGSLLGSVARSRKFRFFMAVPRREDLEVLRGMIEQGALRAPVAVVHPLERTGDAFRHLEERSARGAVVVRP